MATFKTPALEWEEETALETLDQIGPNTVLLITSDETGKKQFLKINPDSLLRNEAMIRNTQTGLCYKFINGRWQWVPC